MIIPMTIYTLGSDDDNNDDDDDDDARTRARMKVNNCTRAHSFSSWFNENKQQVCTSAFNSFSTVAQHSEHIRPAMLLLTYVLLLLVGRVWPQDVVEWSGGTKIFCQNLSGRSTTLNSLQLFNCDVLLDVNKRPLQCVSIVSVSDDVRIDWFMVSESIADKELC